MRNAAQAAQRFFDSISRDLDLVHVCIDDLLITSPNSDEHIQHLTPLFQRLSDNEIVVVPDNCELGKVKLTFLGQEITREDTKPSEDKVRAGLEYVVLPSLYKWFIVIFVKRQNRITTGLVV